MAEHCTAKSKNPVLRSKNPVLKSNNPVFMKKLLLLLLLPAVCFGQGDQTIINVPLDASGTTEKAILHLPNDYSSTSTMYPVMVFLHGIGEGGTNPATLYGSSNAGGPAYFIAQGKFPSSFVNPADGKSYKYIVVSPQCSTGWSTTAYQLDYVLTYLLGHYRIDASRIYLTGLSAGGQGVTEYVGKKSGYGAVPTTHKIAAFVPMSVAEDGTLISPLTSAIASYKVPTWGFGSPTDVYGQYTLNIVSGMNAITSGLGISTSYSGGHCCWNQFYNPTYRMNGKSIYEWALQYTSGASAPASSQSAVSPVSLPGTVQAEAYSGMSGVGTQTTTDAGGGNNVGWIDNGDYMDYSVNVATAGQYTVNFRIATPNTGASLQLFSGSTALTTVSLPNTGGFQSWKTVSAVVNLVAGQQTLRVKSTASPEWNLNWMQFAQGSSGIALPGTIQAENYSSMSGIATQSSTDAGGGLTVGWIDYGDWLSYNVNVATAGSYKVSFRVATPYSGVKLQLLSGSNVLSNLGIPGTGGYSNWSTVTTTVTLPAGQQTLKVYFNSWTHLNLNWIQFASGTATAADESTLDNSSAVLAADSSATFGDKAFTVYPNPVHDQLNLRVYDQRLGALVVQVTDAFGAVKAVYNFNKTSEIFQTSIAAGSWTSGIYFVRIQSGGKTDVRKVVKL